MQQLFTRIKEVRITFFMLLLSCFSCYQTFAQDFDNYKVLRATGKIPEDFTKLSSEKYEEEKDKNNDKNKDSTGKKKVKKELKKEDKFTKKAKDEFYLKNSFGIKDLLISGKVLFGDPATVYVNKVADILLADNPELRKQLRFYVVKSAAVNAFATNDGIICVNLGLLARLNTEAELASILGHEITHYVKKHSIEGYIYSQTVEKERSVFKNTSSFEKRLANSNYSQAHETEADAAGLAYLKETNYDLQQALSVFDILKNAAFPYQNIVFEKSFLENNYLKFPDRFFDVDTLVVAKQDTTKEVLENLFSSHPAPEERQKAIKSLLTEGRGKALYLTSQEEFENVRTLARFDLCDMFIIRANYIDAFYQILLLKKQYPQSKYLDMCMAKALYGIAKYQNYDQKIYIMLDYDEVDWKGKNWYYALEDLNSKEFNVLALSYIWELRKKYADDGYLRDAAEDLLGDMQAIHSFSTKDEIKKPVIVENKTVAKPPINVANPSKSTKKLTTKEKAELAEKLAKESEKAAKEKEKADKEKAKNAKPLTAQDVDAMKKRKFDVEIKECIAKAWDTLRKDTDLIAAFEKASKSMAARKVATAAKKPKTYAQSVKMYQKSQKISRLGYRLGLNKVIFMNPFAIRVDATKKENNVDFIKSEELQGQVFDHIAEGSKRLNLSSIMLNARELSEAPNAETLNNIAVIKEWLSEKMTHSMPAINSRQDDVDEIIDDLGTPHIAFTGVMSLRSKFLLFKKNDLLIYTFVFDIKEHKVLMEQYNYMRLGSKAIQRSIYYHLYQIKKSSY